MYKLKMITIGLVLVKTLFVFNPGLLVLKGWGKFTTWLSKSSITQKKMLKTAEKDVII